MLSRNLMFASRNAARIGTKSSIASSRILPTSFISQRFNLGSVRFLSDETKAAIDKAVESAPVVLFMKGTPEQPMCGFSRNTIQILGYQGVDPSKFAAYNVLDDPELRQGIKEYSSWPTIPQLYVNKEFIGGHDIVVAMNDSGELTELLEKEDVLVPEEEE